jgi:hypothetical protein
VANKKQMSGQIGRCVYANPEGDRYFLRVLLNHVRGTTSYEDLTTVAGVTYSTFKEACKRRGLIKSLDDYLTEPPLFRCCVPCEGCLQPFLSSARPLPYIDSGTSTMMLCAKPSNRTIATRQQWIKYCSET